MIIIIIIIITLKLSSPTKGLFRDNETNTLHGTKYCEKSHLTGGEPVGFFTNVDEDLNTGLPRTNPAGGQGGT